MFIKFNRCPAPIFLHHSLVKCYEINCKNAKLIFVICKFMYPMITGPILALFNILCIGNNVLKAYPLFLENVSLILQIITRLGPTIPISTGFTLQAMVCYVSMIVKWLNTIPSIFHFIKKDISKQSDTSGNSLSC